MAILGSCDYTDWGWWSLVVRMCTYVMNWFIRHDSFTPWTNLLFFFRFFPSLVFPSMFGVWCKRGSGRRGTRVCHEPFGFMWESSFFFFGEGWNTL